MFGKLKGPFVAFGLAMGCCAAFTAMTYTPHSVGAQIRVFDQQNVEEAIKQAINTANILTNEQKQLALHIFQAKKLDPEYLLSFYYNDAMKDLKKNDDEWWNEHCGSLDKGILEEMMKKNHKENPWSEVGMSVPDILNGNMSLADLWPVAQKGLEMQHKTNRAAVIAAKRARDADSHVINVDYKAIEERQTQDLGLNENMALNNSINGVVLKSVTNGNSMLEHMATLMATKYEQEEYQKAVAQRVTQAQSDSLRAFVDSTSTGDSQ